MNHRPARMCDASLNARSAAPGRIAYSSHCHNTINIHSPSIIPGEPLSLLGTSHRNGTNVTPVCLLCPTPMRAPLISKPLLWLHFLCLARSHSVPLKVTVIPQSLNLGESHAQFVSTSSGLDAPKVRPINSSAFDLWYFDVVGDDGKSTVAVSFFTATSSSFPFLNSPTVVTSAGLAASFPNGTLFQASLPATEASVIAIGDGASGIFEGTGFSWTGTPDLSGYVVKVDSPTLGVKGTLVFRSVSATLNSLTS